MFQIEPDASSGSYFWGAGWLLKGRGALPHHTGPSTIELSGAALKGLLSPTLSSKEGEGEETAGSLDKGLIQWQCGSSRA